MGFLRFAFSSAAITAALLLSTGPALADKTFPTTIKNTSAPFSITSCNVKYQQDLISYTYATTISNKSRFAIISLDVRLFYVDSSGASMGQYDYSWMPPNTLSPGDSGSFNGGLSGANEPWQALGSVVCRPQSAVLTGHRTWHYGQTWKP